MMPLFLRQHVRVIGLIALLCALTLAMAGFGGSAQAPLPPASPVSVGQVTNLQARADAQAPGTVKLTWKAAANAQVYFVVYLKSSEARAGNYDGVRTKAFTGTEGAIGGLAAGTPYHFIATGMRWNWPGYGATWGNWSAWSPATPSAGSVATDRAALIAFYNATDGPNWTNNRNWLSTMPLDQWHGVGTERNGRVTELVLHDNGLIGELPTSLASLTMLRKLQISKNPIAGGIPSELGGLSNLVDLSLSYTRLTGSIPPELIGMTGLRYLTLDNNQLTGKIPAELGNLANLRGIRFCYNRLTSVIPPELGRLPRLETMEFCGNQLTGQIPPELGNLVKMRSLHLHNNQLTGDIPTELGKLVNLLAIELGGNRLTGCVPTVLRNVHQNDLARLGLPFCG